MNDWVWELDNAIEDLTNRKRLLQKSITYGDPSIEWALDGLKIIRELLKIHEEIDVTGSLERLITEIHEEKRDTYD